MTGHWPRRHLLTALCIATSNTACRGTDLPESFASSTHVTLPAVDCALAPSPVTPIETDARDVGGAPKSTTYGTSAAGPVVGVIGWDGMYVAELRTDAPAVFRKLVPLGTEPGTVSRISALRKVTPEAWQWVDALLLRRTTVDTIGRYVEHLPLRAPTGTDRYGIGPDGVFAFATEVRERGYERARGTLYRLARGTSFTAETTVIATPSRHATAGGADLALAQRPLEQDPIIAVNDAGDIVLQTSDSLELTYVLHDGAPIRLRGSGTRVTFTEAEIDSASRAYGRAMLPRDPDRPASDAKRMLFVTRKQHQLVDAVQWLADRRLAVRLTRACADRSFWYVLTSQGTVARTFTLERGLDPVGTRGDTLFLRRMQEPLQFVWTTIETGAR